MDKPSTAYVVRQDGERLNVVLFKEGEKDWGQCINAQLI